jgi:hypothetical protein
VSAHRAICVALGCAGLAVAGLWLGHGSAGAESADRGQAISRYSFFEGFGAEPYALDAIPRFVDERGRLGCNHKEMVVHRSRPLRYAVRVHPAFVPRLERFERLVAELSITHYGRAPRRLVHRGAFACRRSRARRERVSEHALGNALDLQGFDFGPLRKRDPTPEDLPPQLRRAFGVRVLSHWAPRRERDLHHARFLHALVEAIRQRPDIFRGIVGPPRPRHRDHLHLDVAPWVYAMYEHESL